MKRKIGIGLMVILNLTFIFVMIMGAVLSYGLITVPMGQVRGLEFANLTRNDLLIKHSIASVAIFLINYFLTKKIIIFKWPFLTSLTITVIGFVIFIPFLLSSRQSFLDYQNGTTQLQHYLDRRTIAVVQIITHADTFQVEQLDDFIIDIGSANLKKGYWKYSRKIKIIFNRTDGSKDSIFTNGQMFGDYKGMFFSTGRNIIDRYIVE